MSVVRGIAAVGLVMMLGVAGCKYAPPPSVTPGSATPAAQPERASPMQTDPGNGYGYGEERQGRRRSKRGRPEAQAVAGQFDFYLLNLSWSPEFCATHATSSECGRGLGFVVHGLWPQDNSGDYPEDCSDAPGPGNPWADTDIYPTTSLVEHEWQTHGTCSGLGADAYFATVHKAFAEVKLPEMQAGSVTPDALVRQLQGANPSFPVGSFAVSCGNNRLTAVEICMDKNLRPEACQGVRSCRAQVMQITGR